MSHALPPPPPGHAPADDTLTEALPPPPVDEVSAAEVHESDVLKRQGRFSWKKFGGDGFMVSLAVHIILAILALFWVVSTYVTNPPKGDPDVFATGAGGGANGDKAKMFEHKLKSRNMQVKMPSRIVSKNANASIALPSTPNTANAAFATGLSSGGMSKGSGGGSGGGEGTGIGIGKGGGRNFVSLFGVKGLTSGLSGYFYDAKQTSDGKPTKYMGVESDLEDFGAAENTRASTDFGSEVLRAVARHWDPSRFGDKIYKAPEPLSAAQIFIPLVNAKAAPTAYGVQDRVKPTRWFAHYKGVVTAPKTGKFRFWGLANNAMIVRWNQKNILDSGWFITACPVNGVHNYPHAIGKPVLGSETTLTGALPQNYGVTPDFRASVWLPIVKGRDYPIEVIIAEIPGGGFGAWLMMEEAGADGKGDGRIFLFRTADDALPEGCVDNTGLKVDMTGKGLIWQAKRPLPASPR